jgi:ADP-ribosylglycohydrolase/fermentation-respiration switch protein FrsA (DUF1100 family)
MKTPADLVLPSFIGDALSLGPHWIYNPGKIARLYPDGVKSYDKPQTDYHPGKGAGDFTHYGDQTLALLHSLVLHSSLGRWTADHWRADWQTFWQGDPSSYRDGATTKTLENLAAGITTPSDSNDLAGASRLAPVIAAGLGGPLDRQVAMARAQTEVTHGDGAVVDSAEFFARATAAVTEGAGFDEAFETAAAADYAALPAVDWLARGRAAVEGDLQEQAKTLGLTCHIPEAFPLTITLALRFENDPLEALSANALTGGDSAARGMVLGLLSGAKHGLAGFPAELVENLNAATRIEALLSLLGPAAAPRTEKTSFPNPLGDKLDAVIDFPAGPPRAFALFAHCFTCGKNLRAANRIGRSLAEAGIATLRFDFTGLGASGGDFADTSFLTNLDDLLAAAGFLREQHQAPAILIGHSLGGAAALAAAAKVPECRAVATIGAPADPEHVTHLLDADLDSIRSAGKAVVTLAGRKFTVGSRFLDDFAEHCQPCAIAELERDLLILHAPGDSIVPVDNARRIYEAARHPKSFVSLASADHLLSNADDADYTARLIAAWATRALA